MTGIKIPTPIMSMKIVRSIIGRIFLCFGVSSICMYGVCALLSILLCYGLSCGVGFSWCIFGARFYSFNFLKANVRCVRFF
mgnify:CR=1 FL=1